MRLLPVILSTCLGLATAGGPRPAAAQHDRDFVLVDEEGHLILRFSGAGDGGLTANQRREMENISLSVMVQDRIWADVEFYAEPIEPGWASSTPPRIEQYAAAALPGMRVKKVECRSASCRLVLEHSGGLDVTEHETLMDGIEHALRAFVDANPGTWSPVFLIAAVHQEPEDPYIKVFLHAATGRRAADRGTSG
jgi:hypothetical protein